MIRGLLSFALAGAPGRRHDDPRFVSMPWRGRRARPVAGIMGGDGALQPRRSERNEAMASKREAFTRRAVLGGAIGAVAGFAGRLMGPPNSAAAAGDPDAVHKGVNNPTSAVTTITSSGTALQGITNTSTANKAGLVGISSSPHASGVFGKGVFGVSGFGLGTTGAGVVGSSSKPGGFGLLGLNQAGSGDAVGVSGQSKGDSGIGVEGRSIGATGNARRGVLGFGKDAGVVGESPKVAMQAFGGEVGVDAFASDTDGVAIRGDVRDGGHNAVAGRFLGGGPNHAFALATEGPITFGTSAGIVTIPAGETNANVTGVYCPAGSKIFATLQTSPGVTSTVAVQLCFRINDTSFEVLLTGQATDAVTVAWLVVL